MTVQNSRISQPAARSPGNGGDWIDVTEASLDVDGIVRWLPTPSCGAVDLFCGTVRDHSPGRPHVTALQYEAYDAYVVPSLCQLAEAARSTWPQIARLALVHRLGRLFVGEVVVVVGVSTPHRAESFAATQWCIDTLKATAPIWRRETWQGGSEWGTCSHHALGKDPV